MKLKLNFNKIALVLILIMCTVNFCGSFVYGRINESYKTSGEIGSIDVGKAAVEATLLTTIARFIYAIAGFIEDMVANIVSIFTGQKMFPWADRVIFNTMPLLDVNFLSPEPGSLFLQLDSKTTDLGNIVRNIYYTIFVLSVTFFGVVVGIMALKLAISSIAAEKAKYKHAITNWLLALILLFTAHYLISFIFFINEKMVEVASAMIDLGSLSIDTDVEKMTTEEKEEVAELTLEDALKGWSKDVYYDKTESLIYYYPDDILNFEELTELESYSAKFALDRYEFNREYKKYVKSAKEHNVPDEEIRSKMEWAEYVFDTYYTRTGMQGGSGDPYRFAEFLEGGEDENTGEMVWGFGFTFYVVLNKGSSLFMTDSLPVRDKFLFAMSILASGTKFSARDDHLYTICLYDTSSEDKYGIYHFNNSRSWTKSSLKNGTTDTELKNEWLTYLMRLYGDGSITEDIDIEGEKDAFALFIDAGYIMLLDNYYGLQDGKVTKQDFINGLDHLTSTKTYYGVSKATDKEHFEKLWRHVQERYQSTTGDYEKEAFTGIAEFFKKSISMVRLVEDEDGKRDIANFNSISAILYSIFVIQSIMYFIAYLKRFFYILVMALFAPLVIIYDFLTKTAMS